MSEFHVRVVRVGPIEKHPNANSLSLTLIDGGYPVIFRTGDYREGDLAVYVPVDSVVPEGDPRWDFLQGHRRIKAKKLRGTFSMGLLTNLPTCGCHLPPSGQWSEGDDAQDALQIVKYEPVMKHLILGQEHEVDPGFVPVYTDIEGLRRHKDAFRMGEEVVLTEKVHGCSGRFSFRDGRLWVGSHRRFMKKAEDGKPESVWWRVATFLGLEERLRSLQSRFDTLYPQGVVLYGEVYGAVQDLNYNVGQEVELRLFDAMDLRDQRYLDHDDFVRLCDDLGLPRVPVIYRGPWLGFERMMEFAEGKTTLVDDGPQRHVREGFVARPVKERWEHSCGRLILKGIGEGYLLRKEA